MAGALVPLAGARGEGRVRHLTLGASLLIANGIGVAVKTLTVLWQSNKKPIQVMIDTSLATDEQIEATRAFLEQVWKERDPDRTPVRRLAVVKNGHGPRPACSPAVATVAHPLLAGDLDRV
jgi:hypothetical protein